MVPVFRNPNKPFNYKNLLYFSAKVKKCFCFCKYYVFLPIVWHIFDDIVKTRNYYNYQALNIKIPLYDLFVVSGFSCTLIYIYIYIYKAISLFFNRNIKLIQNNTSTKGWHSWMCATFKVQIWIHSSRKQPFNQNRICHYHTNIFLGTIY